MDGGQLVPDDVVLDMLLERVALDDCRGGYILDGYPRNLTQARSLSEHLPEGWTETVVELDVDDEELVRRLAGRLVCGTCADIHNDATSVPVPTRCARCGAQLVRRDDDAPEVVRRRLAVYYEETAPVLDYYRERDNLCQVDGRAAREQVFAACLACIQQTSAARRGVEEEV
jgi:adenylate kinase